MKGVGTETVAIIEDHGKGGTGRMTPETAKNNPVTTTIPAKVEIIKTGNHGRETELKIETIRPGVIRKNPEIIRTKIEGLTNKRTKKLPSHQD